MISPIWRRAKHNLLEVVGSQARGAGGRAIGEGLKSPGDLFLRNLDGRGRGVSGKGWDAGDRVLGKHFG